MDQAVRQFFNNKADGWMERCWQDFFAGNDEAMHERLQLLFDEAGIADGSNVLDVGCGDGFLVPFILDRIGPTGTLTELDIADEMIAHNQARHADARITFRVADVADLLPTQAFDAVIAFSCFPHFQDQVRVLQALAGQLKPHGHLAVCHAKSSVEMNAFHKTADPAVSKHRLPDGEAMRELMLKAGLQPLTAIDRPGLYLVTATAG